MTLDECKRIHRDMWNYIAEAEERTIYIGIGDDRSSIRTELKSDFCSRSNMTMNNSCALCEYALDYANQKDDESTYFSVSHNVCQYCPAVWGAENDLYGYYCERGMLKSDERRLDWRCSKASDIRDIKWKDEEER